MHVDAIKMSIKFKVLPISLHSLINFPASLITSFAKSEGIVKCILDSNIIIPFLNNIIKLH